MAISYQGGCQCGKVRYEIRAKPLTLYACHCTECQRQTGSAFGMSMSVPRDAVYILQGEPQPWSRGSASGREVICFFCRECGTRLFHQPTRNPHITNIKPGTLDDTSWLQPVANLWTRSAQPWVHCNTALLNYAGQPNADETAELLARFSQSPHQPPKPTSS